MDERVPDSTICISVEEYKKLLEASFKTESLSHQYWDIKPKYDKLFEAHNKLIQELDKMEV